MADRAVTHYDVLGVEPSASAAQLRDAYVALARRHHPDVDGGDAAQMRAVNAAWATLGDPARRASYDRALAGWPAGASTAPRASSDADEGFDLHDLLADLEDDTPIGGTVVLPPWMRLVPVGMFVASIVLFGLGMLMSAPGLLGMGLVAFLVSCLLFIAAPFVALLASRRASR
jgi:hypothetical protein